MTFVPKFLLGALTALALLLLPALTLAQTGVAVPLGKDAWDLYVYGNGGVIFATLTGIKMLMVPDAGSSGFDVLLLVLATLGFIVLAIGAGFDPSKNLFRMFTYILVVWGVSFGSTRLTTNINVIDMVGSEAGAPRMYLVTGVPALVGLPAALVSQVGRYFTQVMESYFSFPGEFKMTAGAVGQFNLFARMLDDTMRFRLTDPNLRQSVAAYTANCVIPAMASPHGVFGFCRDGSDNCPRTAAHWVGGREALTTAPDYLKLLASARHNAIMTIYWPARAQGEDEAAWISRLQSPTLRASLQGGAQGELTFTAAQARQMGVVLSCNEAFLMIAHDAQAHAEDLFQGSAQAWARTGTQVPFEQAFQTMMAQASAPGAQFAGFSRPSGFILQQAMINSASGSFRVAALQTGNSEIMQAAALAQAEAQQRSTWVASFHMFNAMMGYVFSVLQAFIFAVTPIVVVALMVPGLGKSIFVNYAQILIWLTLWMPMLALINFMITLFAVESVQGVTVFSEGAITAANSGQISERINNLIIASQFLGTMTPLITWGLVKGTLAFTEFISQGLGSSFASQAGASAATGNLSMNNLSMDTTSMNRFSTQMSSAVGFSTISAPLNAAALSPTINYGGGQGTTGENNQLQHAMQVSQRATEAAQETRRRAEAFNESTTAERTWSNLLAQTFTSTTGTTREQALVDTVQKMRSAGMSDAAIVSVLATADRSLKSGDSVGSNASNGVNASVGVDGAAGFGPLVGLKRLFGFNISGSMDANVRDIVARDNEAGRNLLVVNQDGRVMTGTQVAQAMQSGASSVSEAFKQAKDYSEQYNTTRTDAMRQARDHTLSAMREQAVSLERQAEATRSMAMQGTVDTLTVRNLENELSRITGATAGLSGAGGRVDGEFGRLRGGHEAGVNAASAAFSAAGATIAAGGAGMRPPDASRIRQDAAALRELVDKHGGDRDVAMAALRRQVEDGQRRLNQLSERADSKLPGNVPGNDSFRNLRSPAPNRPPVDPPVQAP
jgi:hypothetical protein